MKTTLLITAALGLGLAGASAADIDWSQLPPAATNSGVTFDADIKPLFQTSCMPCHGGNRPRDGLSLDTLAGVLKGTKDGPVVTPGDSANSPLVKAISRLDPKTAMPPKPRRHGPRPGGTNAPAMQPPPDGGPGAGGPPPNMGGGNDNAAGGPPPPPPGGGNDNGPGGPPPMGGGDGGQGGPPPGAPRMGPPSKPLTAEQVGLVRAWIDQGAK